MRAPIIIGGAPSTGSTLLRILLGRHPAIATGGELAIFDKPRLLWTEGDEYREGISSWLDDGVPISFVGGSRQVFRNLEEYPWDRESVRELAGSVSSYGHLVDAFFARTLAVGGAQRWLEKTPSNIYAFDRFRKRYPNAKLIHTVRDGRDVAVSYGRREPSVLRCAARWYYATLTGIRYRGTPEYLEVRYEDLVTRPESVLERVCRFLDEPYTEALLRPDDPYRWGPGGWRLDPQQAIERSSIGRYRDEMSAEQRSVFRSLRLSDAGREALPRTATVHDVPSTPLELQKYLGYGTGMIEDAPHLSSTDVARHWQDFPRHRSRMQALYGESVTCPVCLGSAELAGCDEPETQA